jgi:hypothetical protein
MNKTISFKETRLKINQPILIWNNDGKQPEYYRRFIQDNKKNQIMVTDLLAEIKSEKKKEKLSHRCYIEEEKHIVNYSFPRDLFTFSSVNSSK